MSLVYLVVSVLVVLGAAAAVLSKNLLRAAIALGVGSAALAALFFLLGAPYAGGFELSVGAGLISVLFIIVISLAETPRRQGREP
jgi:NADH:ubiquinone oxidoreductase subunit 6 (subunit J)